jgi:hypothetical protein
MKAQPFSDSGSNSDSGSESDAPLVARATSTGSTLARNRRVRPSAATAPMGSVLRASNTNSGPRTVP